MIEIYKFENVMQELGYGSYATTENYYKAIEMYDNDFTTCLPFEKYVAKNIVSFINNQTTAF